jgi:pimeloyl-ACP methyl ester carboxylesterase
LRAPKEEALPHPVARRLTLSLAALAAVAVRTAAAAPPPLAPCALPGLETGALCATFPVFENREAKSGRTIGLEVVVVPATSGERTEEAITFFAGGPGDASTDGAAYLAHDLEPARERRDLVLVDFRGTGGSDALVCTELVTAGAQGFLDSFLPTDEVAACRARLERDRDLARYTTNEAVDDVAEVLTAYGYRRVNLFGGSYGTRAAQVMARRHPELVRTMILDGVVRLSERDPLDFARAAQQALDDLFAECAADPACAAAFPDLAGDLARALARLDAGPVTVELEDAETGEKRPLRISRHGFAQTIRYLLYVVSSAAAVPFQIHEAATGNFRPLAESASFFGNLFTATADGFFLSVTCPEDVRFIRDDEIAAAVAGTFLGDFRIRQQIAACAAWTPRAPDPAFQAPLDSAIPTLLVSGERDPVTPRSNAELVARHLAHARQLVVPDGAHGHDGLTGIDCLARIANAFIASGTVEGLDSSCLAEMKRPPFVLAGPAPAVALSAAELAAFVGRYRHAESPFELAVETSGESLRLVLAGKPPVALRAVSAERFEIVGLPPGYSVGFERDAVGAVVALLFTEPGSPPARLPRVP